METKLKIEFAAVILAGLCLGTANGAPAGFQCAELDGAGPQTLMEYLQLDGSASKPECIFFAIDRLGLKHYVPAVKILMKYLEYRVPQDPAKERMAVVNRIRLVGDIYPATLPSLRSGSRRFQM